SPWPIDPAPRSCISHPYGSSMGVRLFIDRALLKGKLLRTGAILNCMGRGGGTAAGGRGRPGRRADRGPRAASRAHEARDRGHSGARGEVEEEKRDRGDKDVHGGDRSKHGRASACPREAERILRGKAKPSDIEVGEP